MTVLNKPQIIDVTLRESVYTNKIIEYKEALEIIKELDKISFCDYIEIGYINTNDTNIELKKYNEEYIRSVKEITSKKISCMTNLNQFSINQKIWDRKILKNFDMVRIIIDNDISTLNEAINYFHELGLKVSINCSYLSRKTNKEIKKLIEEIVNKKADILYIADTNGSLFPDQLEEIYNEIKEINNNIKIGFHGHDNYNLVVSNACKMIQKGVDYIDTTIGGFGKAAGNLRLEIIPFILHKINNYQIPNSTIYNLYNLLNNFDNKYIDNYIYLLFAYKNLKLKEINEIKNKSNKDNIVDNILEYDINE